MTAAMAELSLKGSLEGFAELDLGCVDDLTPQITHGDPGGDNVADDGTPDTYRLVLNGGALEAYINGGLAGSFDFPGVDEISVFGSGDDDTLTVDNSAGLIARTIVFEDLGTPPGKGSDALAISGDPGLPGTTRQTYITGGGGSKAGDGTIIFDPDDNMGAGADGTPNGDEQIIEFIGLEPVYDTTPVGHLDIFATGGADDINVVDGPGIGGATNTTEVNEGGGGFESIEFANKTTVTVNGLDGADSITIDNPNPADGMTSLLIYGNESLGVPMMGVRGAALASVLSAYFGLFLIIVCE